ncbi:DUF2690 domain-containing protein [Streptomyces sp. NPDC047981]|uniref:helix-turn-helix domain-containing protein n=1 Tax=Streptomyces sp. NPDC047981 TaxID=3154610 RepID=UPI003431F82F
MPRWQALPDELDPRVREFADRLRRLVDRSGLSVAAVADRTGYSRTAWERYLDGRLLAPKGAVLALAEVTGTDPGRLTAERERAERAWKGSEQGPGGAGGLAPGVNASTETSVSSSHSTTADPESTGPTRAQEAPGPVPVPSPVPVPGRVPVSGPVPVPGPVPVSGPVPVPPSEPPRRPAAALRVLLLLTGVLGALLVVIAAVLLADLGGGDGSGGEGPGGGDRGSAATRTPGTSPASPGASGAGPGTSPLPSGVKCAGAGCTGQDPEAMGCGGTFATTVSRAPVGFAGQIEVRFSRTCGAAWARVTGAAPGDTLHVTAAGGGQDVTVGADPDAYSPMVATTDGTDARACATPVNGTRVCTGGR